MDLPGGLGRGEAKTELPVVHGERAWKTDVWHMILQGSVVTLFRLLIHRPGREMDGDEEEGRRGSIPVGDWRIWESSYWRTSPRF
jgi:hypothetical protein